MLPLAHTELIITDDNYGQLIESLWLQLDIEKQHCWCDACVSNYCKKGCYDCPVLGGVEMHEYFWKKDCEKLIRQRLKKRTYRTCRFCGKDIDKDLFEKAHYSKRNEFVNLHMNKCARECGFLV